MTRARVLRENLSLKVYFSLGGNWVYWRHDFWYIKNSSPEKELGPELIVQ